MPNKTGVLLLTLIAILACRRDPPPWAAVTSTVKKAGDTQSTTPTTDDVTVYLDTSKSIRGYVSSSGSTEYGIALQELRNFASLVKPPLRVSVRAVGVAVSAAESEVLLNRASVNKLVYNGDQTNL